MAIDYASRRRSIPSRGSHSRLLRNEKRRAVQTTLLIFVLMGFFMVAFAFLGINLLARLSLLLTKIRTPKISTVNQDVIPPTAPQLNIPFEATGSATISFNGYGEPSSRIIVYVNGNKSVESMADENGDFNFPSVDLQAGLNTLYAVALDDANNESAHSSTASIIVDQEKPEFELESPQNGSRYYGNLEKLITIKGRADVDVSLRVNDQVIVVMSDGTFSSQYELKDGDNQLNFVIRDTAGNETAETITVNYSP